MKIAAGLSAGQAMAPCRSSKNLATRRAGVWRPNATIGWSSGDPFPGDRSGNRFAGGCPNTLKRCFTFTAIESRHQSSANFSVGRLMKMRPEIANTLLRRCFMTCNYASYPKTPQLFVTNSGVMVREELWPQERQLFLSG